jgi:hypothetical protein
LIAVVGSRLDEAARDLVAAWSAEGALLLSAEDLCTHGWVFELTSPRDGSFVAGGTRRPTKELCGVVVRRPAVAAEELPWIAAEDRQYVAAEINAFLVAWLSALPCPVLNRPSATSLCGPGWSQTYWEIVAAREGIAWSNPRRGGAVREVVFCRGLHHGAASPKQVHLGVKLCALSGAELLGVRFAGEAVAAVSTQPRLTEAGARDLVLTHLRAAVAA